MRIVVLRRRDIEAHGVRLALLIAGLIGFVIGLALLVSGDESMMSKRARGFAAALEATLAARAIATRVHLVDERATSRAASRRLAETGVQRGKRKAALDGEVARILIEEWVASGPLGSATA